MSKGKLITDGVFIDSLFFWCPGCNGAHRVIVSGDNEEIWHWEGDLDNITLSPSVLVTRPGDPKYRCHSFVKNGHIQFLNDCSHTLAGKTVELPEYPW